MRGSRALTPVSTDSQTDGLAEGYTRTLSVDGQGRLWATHGTAVDEVSVNDGYEIRRVPAPGHFGRIFPGASESWAVTVDGLFRFENGKWVRHRVALFDGILKVGDYPDLVAVPLGPGRVFLVTAERLLESSPKLTAIFAQSDLLALGAIAALRARGMRVPEDVSVVGFDDIPVSSVFDPPLTTVRQPMREVGELAARLIGDRAASSRKTKGTRHMLRAPLVIRGSVARLDGLVRR